MFANAFQNSPYVQVWDAKVNVDKNPFYKQLCRFQPMLPGSKYFDKQSKCYLYTINGQANKMCLPAQDKNFLSLNQRYLVLQIFIPVGFNWSLQISLSNLSGTRHRINITTTYGKQQVKYFSFRYPIQTIPKGVWLYLGIDVYSFMSVFKDSVFRAIEQITVGSHCKIRRIFTMKQFVQIEIPKHFWMSQQLPQQMHLIQYQDIMKMSDDRNNNKFSQQLIQSSPAKSIKKQVYNNLDISRSQVHQPRRFDDIKIPNKSQEIVQKAKNRLQKLQKQEQLLLNKSRELLSYKKIADSKDKYLKISLSKQKNQSKNMKTQRPQKTPKFQRKNQKNLSKKSLLQNQIKSSPNPRFKLPYIQKAFKQDIALKEQDQISNFTQQNMKKAAIEPQKRLTTNKQKTIEQDHWSDDGKQQNRPISQAIESYTGNFPATVITKQNQKQVVMTPYKNSQLELIYDEMVGCYFHPQTNTYYEINS